MVYLGVFCLLAAFLQTVSPQCINSNYLPSVLPNSINPTCQQYYPRRPITCYLNIAPEATMNLFSDDLIISGPVVVAGKLPFTGTVALEGALPAAGAGAVDYACGYNVGIYEGYGNYGIY